MRKDKKSLKVIFSALTIPLFVLSSVIVVPVGIAEAVSNDKVTICHATNAHDNPYNQISVNKNSTADGHDGHEGPVWYPGITEKWGDIIPPFTYSQPCSGIQEYPGKNWTSEGQAIWNDGCEVEIPVPETSVTLCKEDDQRNKLSGWELFLISDDNTFSGMTEPKCSNTGCVTFEDVPYGTYKIDETLKEGWENVEGLDNVQIKSDNPKFTVVNKEKEEEPITGSITVCKIIIDSEGNIVDGSEKRGTVFVIPGLSSGDIPGTSPAPIGALPTSEFTTPLQLNADLISNNGNDAQCITYDGLELGGYYYGEELLPGEGWETPLYNDQHITGVSSLTDFFEFSGELLDGDSSNDHERNTDADGHIVLSESRPDRTLVVLNQYKEIPKTSVTLCKEDDDGNKLSGWELFLISDDNTFSGMTEPKCSNTGCVTFEDVPYGTYKIDETLKEGWENVSGLEEVEIDSENREFTVVNREIEEVDVVTIVAYKVVCENESDMPDWAKTSGYPEEITEDLITQYVADSEGKCWFESGWDFEWGYDSTAQKQDGDVYGPAGESKGWNTFDSATGDGTPAVLELEENELESIIWIREVLQEGYIPFAHPETGWDTGEEMVSAELLCHVDGYKYDNYDRVDNPEAGGTYFCVAFNALKEAIEPTFYTVTFDGNSGDPETQTEEVEEGKTMDSLPTVSKEGYNFVGWNIEQDGTGDEFTTSTVVNSDLTVYAIWDEKDPGPGPGPDPDPTTEIISPEEGDIIVVGDDLNLKASFDGEGDIKWAVRYETCEPETDTVAGNVNGHDDPYNWADGIFTAQLDTTDWEIGEYCFVFNPDEGDRKTVKFNIVEPAVVYTVTFDGNGGKPEIQTEEVEEGKTMDSLPTVTRTGYSFVEWNKEKDGEGDEFTSSTQVTAHITVYAQWEVKSYTVSFEDWDNTVLKEEIVEHGSAATAPDDPEREGYVFTGWDTDFTNVTEDLTVTALYEKDTEPEPAPRRRIGGPVYIPTDDPEPEEERITIPLGDPEPEPEPEEEVLGEEIVIDCEIYLHEYIQYGADNNPEEVRKLQLFLNDYMGTSLSVTGIYDQVTMQAVKDFQAKHKDEVLQPWIAAGVHCHTEPTGYVYKTTQRKINLIVCPELDIPMPEVAAYPETDCEAYWAAVLGEEVVTDEDVIDDPPVEEEDPEDVIDPEEEVVTDPEDPEEETEIPWLLILIIIILVIGFGWMLNKNKGGKKGTGFSGKKPTPPQGKPTPPQGKSNLFESKSTPPESKSNMFENKSNPFESRTIPLGGKKPDSFERR